MLDHATLKLVHQGSVLLSITGFVGRGALMLLRSTLLKRRWMRTWPHVIDTVLLGSGVWMAVNLQLQPGANPWLAAKIVALLAYIGLGFVALRLGRTYAQRSLALFAALLCFAYMLLVATTRSVVPF
ncbi:MAG: SirB2 family protein [Gammaproteobacteria bacterium]|nr:SirB2 family protein [Gammaproteobacteria bacterium]